jgi:hypothetical protein
MRLAETGIAERGYAANAPEELKGIVRLALAELRRRRHPFTIRGLCSDEERAKEFLVQFALARNALNPLPGATSLCVRQSEAGTKIQRSLSNFAVAQRTPVSRTRIEVSEIGSAKIQPLTSRNSDRRLLPASLIRETADIESPNSHCPVTLNNNQIADAVAHWFKTRLDPGLWEDVSTEAQFQVTRYPTRYIVQVSFRTLNGLIEKTRVPDTPVDAAEMTNFNVEWLLGWLLALRRDFSFIHGIVGAGYARAKKSSGLLKATCY